MVVFLFLHICTNLGEPRGGERYRVCNGALYRLEDLDRDLDLQARFTNNFNVGQRLDGIRLAISFPTSKIEHLRN